MAAMTAEAAEARFQELEQRVNELLQRAHISDEEHRRTHAELERARAHGSGGKHAEFRLVDPKTMIPDKLGSATGPKWLAWSEGTRAFVEMLSVDLAEKMKRVEGLEDALSTEHLREAAIPDNHAAQLARYLQLRTEGNANTLVKAALANKSHALEIWRKLSWEHDPKGLGSELIELHDLTNPEKLRAKSLAGVSAAIEAWEAL